MIRRFLHPKELWAIRPAAPSDVSRPLRVPRAVGQSAPVPRTPKPSTPPTPTRAKLHHDLSFLVHFQCTSWSTARVIAASATFFAVRFGLPSSTATPGLRC